MEKGREHPFHACPDSPDGLALSLSVRGRVALLAHNIRQPGGGGARRARSYAMRLALLALTLTASASAQTLADSLLARSYQSVLDGPAFSYQFEAYYEDADTSFVVPGTALTHAIPPEGHVVFRIAYDETPPRTLAFDGQILAQASERTQKVYVDSTREHLDSGYLPILALHPTLGLRLHREIGGEGEVAEISKGEVRGKPCTRVLYPAVPAEGSDPALPEVGVCYDRRTHLPLDAWMDLPDQQLRFGMRLLSLKRVPFPGMEAFSLETPEGWRRTNYEGGDGTSLQIGDPAPDFALQTESGETVRLADFRGETVVLDFWGTWCAPCVEVLPAMGELAEAHPEVTVLGLASYELEDATPTAFARERGASYPVLLADTQTLEAYHVYAFPTYFVIGPDGTLLYHAVHDDKAETPTEAALAEFLSGR